MLGRSGHERVDWIHGQNGKNEARHLVPEGRVLMPQALGVGALPWATGTDAQGLLTWGPGDRTD